MFITPSDVAFRLYLRKKYWFHGKPKISLTGEKGTFGVLKFEFGDQNVSFRVWIVDRNWILDVACEAVDKFNRFDPISCEFVDLS